MVVSDERPEPAGQFPLTINDDVVEALSSNCSDDPLDVYPPSWRVRSRQQLPYPEHFDLPQKLLTKDAVCSFMEAHTCKELFAEFHLPGACITAYCRQFLTTNARGRILIFQITAVLVCSVCEPSMPSCPTARVRSRQNI